MENKMTDNEIIKELEGCSCDTLELINRLMTENNLLRVQLDDYERDIVPKLKYSLERANKYGVETDAENLRLLKENERLKREAAILSENADGAFQDGLNEAQDLYASQIRGKVRAEAIKDFAEKLKEMMSYDFETDVVVLDKSKLDNLLKELVGEDDG